MIKTKGYLLLQTLVCLLLVVFLSLGALSIYRTGKARRAENPLEPIYTRQIVAEELKKEAPLFFFSLGLLAAGVVLGIKAQEKRGKNVKALRDLAAERVASPSREMLKERRLQRILCLLGWASFAACMVPVFLYLLHPENFPLADLEGMFYALLPTLIPWCLGGITCLGVREYLKEKSLLRETEAAKLQAKAEKEEGITTSPRGERAKHSPLPAQVIFILLALALIAAGVFNGSARDVFTKAINICTECIGLG